MIDALRSIILSTVAIAVSLLSLSALAADKTPSPSPTAPRSSTQAHLVPAAFARGERLTYIALLNEVPAGDGELRLAKEQQDDREVYRLTAQARTSELLELLYRVRGTVDGTFTANGFVPLFFRLAYITDERPRELGVRYDAATQTLIGSVKRKDRVKERRVPAADVYDPVSALYFLRSRSLTPGSSCQIEVFSGKERYRVAAQVVGKEEVLLASGARPAIRLHLEMASLDDSRQGSRLPRETLLWVSADETHTPLKLESFTPLGQVRVELNQ